MQLNFELDRHCVQTTGERCGKSKVLASISKLYSTYNQKY